MAGIKKKRKKPTARKEITYKESATLEARKQWSKALKIFNENFNVGFYNRQVKMEKIHFHTVESQKTLPHMHPLLRMLLNIFHQTRE